MYLFIEYNSNWADEMDVNGFFITTKELWDERVEAFRKHFEDEPFLTYYVGTNEEIEYLMFEDVLNDFTITEITEEEAKVLDKLFGYNDGDFVGVCYGFTGPEVEGR